jgi:hypothetical protein
MATDPLAIDLAHWRLDDKTFQEERKLKWPMIESLLGMDRRKKKAINTIKKYYFKAELPNWRQFENDGCRGCNIRPCCVFMATSVR